MLVLASSHCPHGQWSSGRCRACPVGQVWVTGTGCVAATDTRRCSSGNTWFETYGGCRPSSCAHGRTSTGHCRAAPSCPHGRWSNGNCRACPVGQVWVTGTGCVAATSTRRCSSGNTWFQAHGGCRPTNCVHGRTSTGHCRTAPPPPPPPTTTPPPPTTTPPPPTTTPPPPPCRSDDHPTVSHWHPTGDGHRGCDTHTTTKTCGTWVPGPGHQVRQLGTCPSTTPVTSCTSSYVFLSRYNGCRPEKCEYDRTSDGYCRVCPVGQSYSSVYNGCRPTVCPTLWYTTSGYCSPVCTDDQVLNKRRDYCLERDPVAGVVGQGGDYLVTRGAYEGTIEAAQMALDGYNNACTNRQYGALTVTRLVAIMFAIPIHEITKDPNRAVSPMTLSRWDGWYVDNGKHRKLYSHWTLENHKRAHWNPGVNLWQIDEMTLDLNHAERADTTIGGLLVARHLRDQYCAGTNALKDFLRDQWHGCKPDPKIPNDDPDKCYATYQRIYIRSFGSQPETLNVRTVIGSDTDGGVQDRSCRWGPSGKIFDCYLYNVEEEAGFRQGWLDDMDPFGRGARTPLAAPFISFTDPYSDIMYAVFPRSTALYGMHDNTFIKAVPKGTNPRESDLGPKRDGWYNNTVDGKALYVNCRIGERPLGSQCAWENTNDES